MNADKRMPMPPTRRLKKKRIAKLRYLMSVVLSERKKSNYKQEIIDLEKAIKHQEFIEAHRDELT